MSLLDMINWSLFAFVKALQTLSMEMAVAARKAYSDPAAQLSNEDQARFTENLNFITRECRKLLLEIRRRKAWANLYRITHRDK